MHDQRSQVVAFILRDLANRTDGHGMYAGGRTWTEKTPLDAAKIERHIDGGHAVGVHAIGTDNTSRWICWDIDAHDDGGDEDAVADANWSVAMDIASKLDRDGTPYLVEDSNGKGGLHVWVRFDSPVAARDARAWARGIYSDDGVELFPKQDSIRDGGWGNYVRLPGKHPKRDHWSRLWIANKTDPGGTWYSLAEPDDDAWSIYLDWEAMDAARVPASEPDDPVPGRLTGSTPDAGEAVPEYAKQGGGLGAEDDGADLASAIEALWRIPAKHRDDYDTWLRIGMALHHISPDDAGLAIWRKWSRHSPKFEAGACEDKWATFRTSASGGVGLGTIKHYAGAGPVEIEIEAGSEARIVLPSDEEIAALPPREQAIAQLRKITKVPISGLVQYNRESGSIIHVDIGGHKIRVGTVADMWSLTKFNHAVWSATGRRISCSAKAWKKAIDLLGEIRQVVEVDEDTVEGKTAALLAGYFRSGMGSPKPDTEETIRAGAPFVRDCRLHVLPSELERWCRIERINHPAGMGIGTMLERSGWTPTRIDTREPPRTCRRYRSAPLIALPWAENMGIGVTDDGSRVNRGSRF